VAAYVSVLAGLAGGNVSTLVGGLSQMVLVASISGYSRDKEREADRVGLTLVAQAGYDPREGRKLFDQMLRASAGGRGGANLFYATHPKMEERVESCDDLADRLPESLVKAATEVGVDRYVAAALPLIVAEVERHITQGRFALSGETLEFLETVRPHDAGTHALRGEWYRARGEPGDADKARTSYAEALANDRNNTAALRGLGLLRMRADDHGGAIRFLEEYLKHAGDAHDAALIRDTVNQLKASP
jgi:predicted Zn-dependent protease